MDAVASNPTAADVFSTVEATPGTPIQVKDDRVSKDAFLQLLVAQLANQDPLNPTTNEEFLGQLAQLQSLEETNALNENISAMTEVMSTTMSGLFQSQSLLSGASLMGSSVRASTDEGVVAGTVTKVSQEGGEVYVTVDEQGAQHKVQLSDVLEVVGLGV